MIVQRMLGLAPFGEAVVLVFLFAVLHILFSWASASEDSELVGFGGERAFLFGYLGVSFLVLLFIAGDTFCWTLTNGPSAREVLLMVPNLFLGSLLSVSGGLMSSQIVRFAGAVRGTDANMVE